MKKIVSRLLVVLLLLPLSLSAQTAGIRSANFTYHYDLDSTTLTFCRLVGAGNNPWNPGPIAGTARIKTTGSAVAVVAVTAGQLPFANLGVGDIITVRRPNGTVDVRVIQTKTDGDNITVQTAVNWDQTTGFVFRWLDLQCGTTDTDGWIDTGGASTKQATFLLEQVSGVTGGIDVRWECRGQALGSLPNIVHPGASATAICTPGTTAGGFCNFTTAGVTTGRFGVSVSADQPCAQMRVGMKINTSDAAETVEGDNERITVTLEQEFVR